MQALDRAVPKSELIEQYEICDGLTEEMKERMKKYLLSLHGIKEKTLFSCWRKKKKTNLGTHPLRLC